MKKAELICANFDARIPKIEIKPHNIDSKVIIFSKMYDEETKENREVRITFKHVIAIDFQVNLFDCMIGAEVMGLYGISDQSFMDLIVQSNFERRKEVYLLEGDYDYDEKEEHDMLNSFDILEEYTENKNLYKAYIQNVDAGVYIIIAKECIIDKK